MYHQSLVMEKGAISIDVNGKPGLHVGVLMSKEKQQNIILLNAI